MDHPVGMKRAFSSGQSAVALPVVYHPHYVTPLPDGHRFPMPKFGLIRDELVACGVVEADIIACPQAPASRPLLGAVHDKGYVDAFCEGRLDPEAMRRIGLPWSPGLVTRTRTAVAGTLLTARLALDPAGPGVACNTAGGTHHAHRSFGSGFCIFNDLAVTAQMLLNQGEVDQVLVIDLDVHQGDGTAAIFTDEPRVFTFSMHCGDNFPLRKVPGDLDVALPRGMGDLAYLDLLRGTSHGHKSPEGFGGIAGLITRVEPDLVLYDAGVDVHRDDRLGYLDLTDAGVWQRDHHVIQTCQSLGVPVACVIGGGYDRDVPRLARRHAILHHAAQACLNGHPTEAAAHHPAITAKQ